jgi:hypothetical protein
MNLINALVSVYFSELSKRFDQSIFLGISLDKLYYCRWEPKKDKLSFLYTLETMTSRLFLSTEPELPEDEVLKQKVMEPEDEDCSDMSLITTPGLLNKLMERFKSSIFMGVTNLNIIEGKDDKIQSTIISKGQYFELQGMVAHAKCDYIRSSPKDLKDDSGAYNSEFPEKSDELSTWVGQDGKVDFSIKGNPIRALAASELIQVRIIQKMLREAKG